MSKKRGAVCKVSVRAEAALGAKTEFRDNQMTNMVSDAQNVSASATTRGPG